MRLGWMGLGRGICGWQNECEMGMRLMRLALGVLWLAANLFCTSKLLCFSSSWRCSSTILVTSIFFIRKVKVNGISSFSSFSSFSSTLSVLTGITAPSPCFCLTKLRLLFSGSSSFPSSIMILLLRLGSTRLLWLGSICRAVCIFFFVDSDKSPISWLSLALGAGLARGMLGTDRLRSPERCSLLWLSMSPLRSSEQEASELRLCSPSLLLELRLRSLFFFRCLRNMWEPRLSAPQSLSSRSRNDCSLSSPPVFDSRNSSISSPTNSRIPANPTRFAHRSPTTTKFYNPRASSSDGWRAYISAGGAVALSLSKAYCSRRWVLAARRGSQCGPSSCRRCMNPQIHSVISSLCGLGGGESLEFLVRSGVGSGCGRSDAEGGDRSGKRGVASGTG